MSFGRVALFRQACSGRLYFDFPFVCVCVYMCPLGLTLLLCIASRMCLVINETFFVPPREEELGKARDYGTSPRLEIQTFSSIFSPSRCAASLTVGELELSMGERRSRQSRFFCSIC